MHDIDTIERLNREAAIQQFKPTPAYPFGVGKYEGLHLVDVTVFATRAEADEYIAHQGELLENTNTGTSFRLIA